MTSEPDEEHREETELQSDPSWDYYHEFVRQREQDPASSFEQFLEKVPTDYRDQVRQRIEDLEFTESLLEARRQESETPEIEGFEIERALGRGGMGRVFLARRLSDGRRLALKVFRSQPIFEKRARALFAREVSAIAALDHPSIGRILDKDPSGQGRWIAMEFIDGVSLAAEIQAQKERRDRDSTHVTTRTILPPWESGAYIRRVTSLMLDLAKALAHAHRSGVYHRDIKPGNILIRDGGPAVLVDFGLAKIMEEESHTGVGDLLGTLGYMSPEQILARRVPIDHRTDLWSLGVTFYEVLALQRPFDAEDYQEVHRQICFEEPKPIQRVDPRIPSDLARILERCLQKNPRHRFGSADAIVLHLEEFLEHRKSSLPTLPLTHRLGVGWRRHRGVASAGLLIVLILVAMVGASIWSRSQAFHERAAESRSHLASRLAQWEDRLGSLSGAEIRRAVEEAEESLRLFGEERSGSAKAVLEKAREEARRRRSEGGRLMKQGALAGHWDPKSGDLPDPYLIAKGKQLVEDAGLILHGDRDFFREEILPHTHSWMTIRKPILPEGVQGRIRVLQARWVDKLCRFADYEDLPVELGKPFTLPPGIYRFTVLVDGFGFGEYVRRLTAAGERQELTPRIRETQKIVAEGMTLVEGGDCIVGGNERLYPYRRHRVRMRSFYMDTHEVTVGEYLAFMEATGSPQPRLWPPTSWRQYRDRLESDWKDYPVVQVTIQQARAYAEWKGKRLPTAWEWERAARGKEGHHYLWGDQWTYGHRRLSGEQIRSLSKRFGLDYASLHSRDPNPLVQTLMRLYPVGSFDGDRSSDGIYDLLGNAMEWTETLTLNTWSRMDPKTFLHNNMIIPSRTSYLIKGASVASLRASRMLPMLALRLDYFSVSQGQNGGRYIGFRCVKSLPR